VHSSTVTVILLRHPAFKGIRRDLMG
jgi:hypothetical protein